MATLREMVERLRARRDVAVLDLADALTEIDRRLSALEGDMNAARLALDETGVREQHPGELISERIKRLVAREDELLDDLIDATTDEEARRPKTGPPAAR